MNIFSNIGITELIVILLLALLVVGPERLPELARQLGKTLRDLRTAYDKLTKDLGPELTSIQKSTQELRDSVESIRSIPQDMVQSVVKAADLDETVGGFKEMAGDIRQVGQTLSAAQKTVRDPMKSAVDAARGTLQPAKPAGPGAAGEQVQEASGNGASEPVGRGLELEPSAGPAVAEDKTKDASPPSIGEPPEEQVNE
jgi:sec-independent protein translocase protein TatB